MDGLIVQNNSVLRQTFLLAGGLLAVSATLAQTPSAAEIIRLAYERDEQNDVIARQYTFRQRVEVQKLDKQDAIHSSKSRTHDVTLLDGSEYKRLIVKNDQPLSPEEERKEQRKLDKSIHKVQNETPRQRAKRLAERDEAKEEQRKWIAEIQNTFHFRLRGEETVAGIETYVIEADPKPGYKPAFGKAKFLTKMKGIFWIGKTDYSWVRIEAETLDTISFGWVLFRLGKGSAMRFTQTKVNDEVWMRDSFRVRLNGRVALLKDIYREILGAYSEFRKFSADSNLTFTGMVERTPQVRSRGSTPRE